MHEVPTHTAIARPAAAYSSGAAPLLGRELERLQLESAVTASYGGNGTLFLLAGDAGVGKTRLACEVLGSTASLVIRGSATEESTPPYGPLVEAAREYLRVVPRPVAVANDCGPLGMYLGLLLPELGAPVTGCDRSTLHAALRCLVESMARARPGLAVFLDDLQWADAATLELLPAIATWVEHEPLVVVGAYRSDEIPRGHPVRHTRTELRRVARLRELSIQPLGPEATAELARYVFGAPPGRSMSAMLYERTQGMPFFIEELAAALVSGGYTQTGPDGVALAKTTCDLPVPDTVRDAVLLRTDGLPAAARQALGVAAVLGLSFEVGLVEAIAPGTEEALIEVVDRGLLVAAPDGPGRIAFRHALVREALYGDMGLTQRRDLHRRVAAELERRGAPPGAIAEHWLAARALDAACKALLAAAQSACAVHAYHDASAALRRVLDLWPDGSEAAERLTVLDQYGRCAELSGDLTVAAGAWRELVDGHHSAGNVGAAAEVERRLAGLYQLQGAWERALAAHESAAADFAASDRLADAADERLAIAAHLRLAGAYSAALRQLALAANDIQHTGRVDLRARLLGLEGNVRARMGQYQTALEQLRAGLELALEHDLSDAAADVYHRLADALEQSGDFASARKTFLVATDFCETHGATAMDQLCRACLTAVLLQTGEWERCIEICQSVVAPEASATANAQNVALGILGLVYALRGETRRARPVLVDAVQMAHHAEFANMELLSTWGLAVCDELDGGFMTAMDRCRVMLDRWRLTEERHFVIRAVRWAASLFARHHQAADARACANALAIVVSETSASQAVAALGHALGELSLLDGRSAEAVEHFNQALMQLDQLDLPYERAYTAVRAAAALDAAGDRAAAVERLAEAHRLAIRLGARPLAATAARELVRLDEPLQRRLGRRAAGQLERGGLTRREVQVVRLVAVGRTNAEIGRELVLSTRTVDMHVRNILDRLDCRSRAEATRRASELGLLVSSHPESSLEVR